MCVWYLPHGRLPLPALLAVPWLTHWLTLSCVGAGRRRKGRKKINNEEDTDGDVMSVVVVSGKAEQCPMHHNFPSSAMLVALGESDTGRFPLVCGAAGTARGPRREISSVKLPKQKARACNCQSSLQSRDVDSFLLDSSSPPPPPSLPPPIIPSSPASPDSSAAAHIKSRRPDVATAGDCPSSSLEPREHFLRQSLLAAPPPPEIPNKPPSSSNKQQ